MDYDRLITRTIPRQLVQAMQYVQDECDRDYLFFLYLNANPQHRYRIASLIWLSITLHGYPGREDHMIRLLNGKYRSMWPIFYSN